ncbi:MAG: trehalose-phosphatase [Betaproteobacteria bacterium]
MTDFDGTLVDFSDRPDEVLVPAELLETLDELMNALNGAVAVISGRRYVDLHRFLGNKAGLMVGSHGAEWPLARGSEMPRLICPPFPPDALASLHRQLGARRHLNIEHKGASLAIHHRLEDIDAFELAQAVRRTMGAYPGWLVFAGHRVIEMRSTQVSKATAAAQVLSLEPFARRMAICLGDDVADIDFFDAVASAGGVTVAVGPRVQPHAQYALSTPLAARAWLRKLAGFLRPAPR